MEKLPIIAYLDGRPGHDKQTLAVIRGLESLTTVSVEKVSAKKQPDSGTGWLMGMASSVLLRQSRYRAMPGRATTILIGSGRRTHPPLLRAKYRYGPNAVAICVMDPGWPQRRAFDLCLVPAHDNLTLADNIVPTTGPPCLTSNEKRHDKQQGLILIGGLDQKSHHWETDETCRQVETLITREPERRWTISSSPRTPAATRIRLAALAADRPGQATFHQAEETAPGWIEEQYQQNDVAWVTADSISMVYEALSAGCRVGILPVKWRRANNKFLRSLKHLSTRGLVVDFNHWLRGTPLPAANTSFDEAERCAREILQRWWPARFTEETFSIMPNNPPLTCRQTDDAN